MNRSVPIVLALLALAPLAGALPLPPVHDDAGTGRDAPTAPAATFTVATNVVHEARAAVVLDPRDTYGFHANAGDSIQLLARGTLGCFTLIAPNKTQMGTYGCSYGEALTLDDPPVTLAVGGIWYASFDNLLAGPYRFVIARNAPAPDVSLAGKVVSPSVLARGSDPTCGTGQPVTQTGGSGDAALPSLAYAALKTGFRAVVAWETEEASAATLTASLDGGAPVVYTEATARRQHVFVLDALPEGASLCFTPEGGGAHTMRLANAMNAHDGDAYTVNLLVLANEQPEQAALLQGLDDFATLLHDATDGHLQAGQVITLFGDYERHNSGWISCYLTSIFTGDRPFCQNVYDVIFTYDGSVVGAAQTYADAIRDPAQAIWMDQEFQGGLVTLPDEEGVVLNHEMGHYAFGAQDLYGNVTGTDPDCWVPEKGLSVMGGNRGANEYDDELNRCPNEAGLEGYVPTWTLLREDFPLVPDRAGLIDAGPAGDGGAYERHSFVLAPQASETLDLDPQDDAGSGRDAGDDREGAVAIEPGVAYDALGLGPAPDLIDSYVFHGLAGQTASIFVDGSLGCYTLLGPDETQLENACSYSVGLNTGPLVVTLPASGEYHLEVANLVPAVYRFGVGLDAAAPVGRLL